MQKEAIGAARPAAEAGRCRPVLIGQGPAGNLRRKDRSNPVEDRTADDCMSETVFAELTFWLLVALSLVVPFGIYGVLLARRAISRPIVLVFGFALVAIAGADVYLLQRLAALVRLTPSLADDAVFLSGLSAALYLLPALFGGIGINIVSHVLVRHLDDAESRFRAERPGEQLAGGAEVPDDQGREPVMSTQVCEPAGS